LEPHQPLSSELPREIANYRILSRIAEGGMGIVYEALQESPRRRIALKVLKSGLSSTDARRRFEYECGLLGRLRHPCIAQVYQAASFELVTGHRVPVFAMELVQDGLPITEFARERQLTRRQRLELFLKVLDGVQHGHQHAIVHRDLKPHNILVDAGGQPKIIDFGVARELEPSDHDAGVQTHTGELLGTPRYMSPEQCGGRSEEIDVRTDVYSLGVVLFELLTGELPYTLEGGSIVELARVIREQAPARLSAVAGTRPDDLDTIAAKALEKVPDRRYASVTALADDIRRYLHREPIAARPPSAAYQLKMFARRNTAAVVGLVAVVTLSLVAALVGTGMALRLSELAGRERALRSRSLVAAASFAARMVGKEVDQRWVLLESESASRELVAALSEARDRGTSPDREVLQAWLQGVSDTHRVRARAESWFVTDAAGVQRARVPYDDTTVGTNFAFRDYFHGGGRDLSADEATGVRPLQEAHRSNVFRSQATDDLMVAFTVPIWGEADPGGGRTVLGVLGMTVELGQFEALQLGPGSEQVAVLVDTRADSSGRRGLVVHHAELARLQAELRDEERRSGTLPSYYVLPEALERFGRLSEARSARARPSDANVPSTLAFEEDWRDPVGGPYTGPWLAAFEPVRDTGWVVVVQERAGAEGGD
jgi:hypothetical protein